MTDSLKVIALVSGGKDSFFSVLQCLSNGHRIVALGNLYPGSESGSDPSSLSNDEIDLNSFMYQTVGHTVIPLYEKALGIPLYRQPIIGTAVQTGTTYNHGESKDETESLIPLLKRIMADHPEANALSTGAILSTYQRTRVESVALRLGLTPISYLWQYPILPPRTQTSLLYDMQAVELDARIIKVASGGLDDSFLWENIASEAVIRRAERSMKRFGMDGNGAVLGEGGEFETLVLDGPSSLFKGRIEILEKDRKIVREGGGSFWLRIMDAKVVMKDPQLEAPEEIVCRTPEILETSFCEVLTWLSRCYDNFSKAPDFTKLKSTDLLPFSESKVYDEPNSATQTYRWTVYAEQALDPERSVTEEAELVLFKIKTLLTQSSLSSRDIISTVIVLRAMRDFSSINKVYGALFTEPHPPARVTVSCGDTMPEGINIIIHVNVQKPTTSLPTKKALHVQSRSYWAPANIGPYSQAIATPIVSNNEEDDTTWAVSVAGQIPLVPATMALPSLNPHSNASITQDFEFETVLALQHLWRIGVAMNITWWTSAAAYLPHGSLAQVQQRARITGQAWLRLHAPPPSEAESDDGQERDLWEEKFYAGMEVRTGGKVDTSLPDWDWVSSSEGGGAAAIPPFFTVEVEELPRASDVEWHAHLGIAGAAVTVDVRAKDGSWTIYRCAYKSTEQFVLTIAYSDEMSISSRWREDALSFVKKGIDDVILSYLDTAIIGPGESYKGVVPCRSLWDISGERLSTVLII